MNFMSECKPGGSFGEIALLHHAPRAATVTAASDGIMWVIDRIAFKSIMMASHKSKLKSYIESFTAIPQVRKLEEIFC
jgi:CRP-like cAMP-binding protein